MKKIISILILLNFTANCVLPSQSFAQTLTAVGLMPKPGAQVALTPAYTPAHLQGMVIDPNDPFKFNFIVSRGDEILSKDQKQNEYAALIKYFLDALAVPDTDQWVNLSPYEKGRIIPDNFGLTEMVRDLLAQDYLLKQISASLTNPDTDLGKKFWAGVYSKAYEKFGSTDIPTDTFNKVWITPDKAVVYEKGNRVVVLEHHLKVMLESDYRAITANGVDAAVDTDTVKLSKQVAREVIVPAIEKEVNEGKSFAPLRQVYSGMLLATWYKLALKESILGKLYADKSKVKGVDQDPKNNQAIYDQYVQAFQKGVFNMIKEDVDQYTRELIPRKYFSGGTVNEYRTDFAQSGSRRTDAAAAHMASERVKNNTDVVAVVVKNESDVVSQKAVPAMTRAALVQDAVERFVVMSNSKTLDNTVFQEVMMGLQSHRYPYNEFRVLSAVIAGLRSRKDAGDLKNWIIEQLLERERKVTENIKLGVWEEFYGNLVVRVQNFAENLKNDSLNFVEALKTGDLSKFDAAMHVEKVLNEAKALQDLVKGSLFKALDPLFRDVMEAVLVSDRVADLGKVAQYVTDFKGAIDSQSEGYFVYSDVLKEKFDRVPVEDQYEAGIAKEVIARYASKETGVVARKKVEGGIDRLLSVLETTQIAFSPQLSFSVSEVSALVKGVLGTLPSLKESDREIYIDALVSFANKTTPVPSGYSHREMLSKMGINPAVNKYRYISFKLTRGLIKQESAGKTNKALMTDVDRGRIRAAGFDINERDDGTASFTIVGLKSFDAMQAFAVAAKNVQYNFRGSTTKEMKTVIEVSFNAAGAVKNIDAAMLEIEDYSHLREMADRVGAAVLFELTKGDLKENFKAGIIPDQIERILNETAVSDAVSHFSREYFGRGSEKTIRIQMYFQVVKEFLRDDVPPLVKRAVNSANDILMKGVLSTPIVLTFEKAQEIWEEVAAGGAVDNAGATGFTKGGIDFARSNLDMQIKRDGAGVPLPVSQQDLDNIHINGLVPVILDIKPASSVPALLQ